jgi:quercetin dioxygenase-like cupin family protein
MREIRGPTMTLRLLVESDELLAMEGEYDGDGGMPPPHLHPRQDEHFEVLEGTIRAVIDGFEQRFAAGDAFDVPAGVVHQMAAEGPARVRWEVRPALRTAEFFTRLYSGDLGPGFLEEYAEEIRLVPPDG